MAVTYNGQPINTDGLQRYIDPANRRSSKSLSEKLKILPDASGGPRSGSGYGYTFSGYIRQTGVGGTIISWQDNQFNKNGGRFTSGLATGTQAEVYNNPNSLDLVGVATAPIFGSFSPVQVAHLVSHDNPKTSVGNVYMRESKKFNYNFDGFLHYELYSENTGLPDGFTIQWTKSKSVGTINRGRVQSSDTIHALEFERNSSDEHYLKWYKNNSLQQSVQIGTGQNLLAGISSNFALDYSTTGKCISLKYNHDAKVMAVCIHNQAVPLGVSTANYGLIDLSTFYNQTFTGNNDYSYIGYETPEGSIGIGKTWFFDFQFDDDEYYMGVGASIPSNNNDIGNFNVRGFGVLESPTLIDIIGNSNVNVALNQSFYPGAISYRSFRPGYSGEFNVIDIHDDYNANFIGFENPFSSDGKRRYVKINPYGHSGTISIEPKSFSEEIFPRTNDFTYSMWVEMDVVDPKNVFVNFGLVGITTDSPATLYNDDDYSMGRLDFKNTENTDNTNSTFNFSGRKESLNNSNLGYLIYYDAESGEIRLGQSPNNSSDVNTIASAPWSPTYRKFYFLSFVREGNDFKFYVDGGQVGISSDITGTDIHSPVKIITLGSIPTIYERWFSTSSGPFTQESPIVIINNPAYYLKGSLGKFISHTKALSGTEILEWYHKDNTVMDKIITPPCYSKFGGTSGATSFTVRLLPIETSDPNHVLSQSLNVNLSTYASRFWSVPHVNAGIGVTWPSTIQESKYTEAWMLVRTGQQVRTSLLGIANYANNTRLWDPDYTVPINDPEIYNWNYRTGVTTSNYNPYDYYPTNTITYSENGIVKEEKKYYPGNPDNYKYFTPIKVRFTEPNATVSVSATCRQADCLLNPTNAPYSVSDYDGSTWMDLGYLTCGNYGAGYNANGSGGSGTNLTGGIPTVYGTLNPGGVIATYALIPIEQGLWPDTMATAGTTRYG